MNKSTENLKELLAKTAAFSRKELEPLLEYLKLELKADELDFQDVSSEIAEEICLVGGNSIANFARGGLGVPYCEIVKDVAEHLKVQSVNQANSLTATEENEQAIIENLFSDILAKLTDEERQELYHELEIDEEGKAKFGGAALGLAQLAFKLGGFASYKIFLLVANSLAKSLLGRGLAFATNTALTRSLAVFVSPVGWIASGLWVGLDLASPAYRKTVPCVVQIALLREMINRRTIISVVGPTSSGKDSFLKTVFNCSDAQISAMPGSTEDIEITSIDDNELVHAINFPGFNDRQAKVNKRIEQCKQLVDLTVFVTTLEALNAQLQHACAFIGKEKLRNSIVCLNKMDTIKNKEEWKVVDEAINLLIQYGFKRENIFTTALDADPRLLNGLNKRILVGNECKAKILKRLLSLLKNTAQNKVDTFESMLTK
jgi:uncharacterized protein YaaW (UPF0174 family)